MILQLPDNRVLEIDTDTYLRAIAGASFMPQLIRGIIRKKEQMNAKKETKPKEEIPCSNNPPVQKSDRAGRRSPRRKRVSTVAQGLQDKGRSAKTTKRKTAISK